MIAIPTDPIAVILGLPLIAAAALATMPSHRMSSRVNVLAAFATLMACLQLFWHRPEPTDLLFIDDFNVYLVMLTAFVGFTSSIFSAGYIAHEVEIGRLAPLYLRFYSAMFQLLQFSMLLALVANNLGVLWVAVEAATLTTVVMVSLYRTREAIEAAWKYFILASVGISLALFGTILIYLAAQPAIGPGIAAMAWTEIMPRANQMAPELLNLAFVFLLVGYGTKVGLFPLHAWLPDAHSEGPTPISAVLSGLLLNVALYAVVRFKMLLAANGEALSPGPLMIAVGLASLIFAAVMLYRRRDIKRMFAYSSIEHMGIATFAFGMGGPLANFAGLLHMGMHSLTKSAIFFTVGHIAQVKGTQRMDDISGLTVSHPWLGWTFVIAVLAISGLPPFGLFMSEFLLVTSSFARAPALAILLVLGLLLGFAAMVMRVQSLAFGTPQGPTHGDTMRLKLSLIPILVHLGLVLVAGLWLPAPLVAWFQAVALMLG
ncbi:MAG: hydrogenase 4 subunit F [Alphaproteobacteria bacterium]|nr:hydrogenase 4 subunit F [Alphaproteobacteria bacterium]